MAMLEQPESDDLLHPFYDQRWILSIGISNYEDRHQQALPNACNDARDVAALLRDEYRFKVLGILRNEQATQVNLQHWLRDKLPLKTHTNDCVVIFFSGHGVTQYLGDQGMRGYIVTYDAAHGSYARCIDMDEFSRAFRSIPAKHIFLILDCCFSGFATQTWRGDSGPLCPQSRYAYLSRLTQQRAWNVLTAGTAKERTADSGIMPNHSAFTGKLLYGLSRNNSFPADLSRDNLITGSELKTFIVEETHGQTPQFDSIGGGQGEFVFIIQNSMLSRDEQAVTSTPADGGDTFTSLLSQMWNLMVTQGAHATPEQLRDLALHAQHLKPRFDQMLFLLRSAVAWKEPTGYWLSWLQHVHGVARIMEVEDVVGTRTDDEDDAPDLPLEITNAKGLLGFMDMGELLTANTSDATPPRLLQLAAIHPNPVERETALLAYSVVAQTYSQNDRGTICDLVEEIRSVCRSKCSRRLSPLRRTELISYLAEANQKPVLNCNFSLFERLSIWGWRVWRRIYKYRQMIAATTVSGGVGGGVALAIWYLILALLSPSIDRRLLESLTGFFYGFLLCGGLALGSVLARPLLLQEQIQTYDKEPIHIAYTTIAIGGIFFGAVNAFLNLAAMYQPGVVILMSFVCGVAVSAGLYLFRRAAVKPSRKCQAVGIVVTAVTWLVSQWIVSAIEYSAIEGATFGWWSVTAAGKYGQFFDNRITYDSLAWFAAMTSRYPLWHLTAAIVESAIVGTLLLIGTWLGLSLARRYSKSMNSEGVYYEWQEPS